MSGAVLEVDGVRLEVFGPPDWRHSEWRQPAFIAADVWTTPDLCVEGLASDEATVRLHLSDGRMVEGGDMCLIGEKVEHDGRICLWFEGSAVAVRDPHA